MKLKIEIDTDNDALVAHNVDGELDRIFKKLLLAIDGEAEVESNILDSNGNTVGHFEFENFRLLQQSIRMTIVYDPADADTPVNWEWHDLLDISPDNITITWSGDPEPFTEW